MSGDGGTPSGAPGMFSNPLFNAAPPASGSSPSGFSHELFSSAPNPYLAPPLIAQPSTAAPPRSAPVTMQERIAQFQANGGHK